MPGEFLASIQRYRSEEAQARQILDALRDLLAEPCGPFVKTEEDVRAILILSAQADRLALLHRQRRLSDEEFIERMNALRRQWGLDAITGGENTN